MHSVSLIDTISQGRAAQLSPPTHTQTHGVTHHNTPHIAGHSIPFACLHPVAPRRFSSRLNEHNSPSTSANAPAASAARIATPAPAPALAPAPAPALVLVASLRHHDRHHRHHHHRRESPISGLPTAPGMLLGVSRHSSCRQTRTRAATHRLSKRGVWRGLGRPLTRPPGALQTHAGQQAGYLTLMLPRAHLAHQQAAPAPALATLQGLPLLLPACPATARAVPAADRVA